MKNNPLQMLTPENTYEQIWETHPGRFDPTKNAMERDRVNKTLALITSLFELQGKKVVDIGCGSAPISRHLENSSILALDIATNALATIPNLPNIEKKQGALPSTSLPDNTYDLCLATEVIAELPHQQFRLAMAELCRVIKADGRVVGSTPIDIYSEDALERFVNLVETEFRISHWVLRHHALYLKLLHFVKAPAKFFNAWRDPKKRALGLEKRRGFQRTWFRINSTLLPIILWAPISLLLKPVVYLMEQSSWILIPIEKLCKLFQGDRGISHVTFVGTRRPLLEEKEEPPLPDRAPFRRDVRWE